jgi:hypothetical protein
MLMITTWVIGHRQVVAEGVGVREGMGVGRGVAVDVDVAEG